MEPEQYNMKLNNCKADIAKFDGGFFQLRSMDAGDFFVFVDLGYRDVFLLTFSNSLIVSLMQCKGIYIIQAGMSMMIMMMMMKPITYVT